MSPLLSDLISQCSQAFKVQFKRDPTIGVQAPGRVNIIGEHTDYNDGFVLPMAIPLYTVMIGAPNDTNEIRIETLCSEVDEPRFVQFPVPKGLVRLAPGVPKWANYVKGVIEHFPCTGQIPGFDATIFTTVPLGGGLSSSAALEVATCTFLEALTGNKIPLNDKALLCQKAEHTFAGMPCGIMDQFISVMGKENCALLIDCRSLETSLVSLGGGGELEGSSSISSLENEGVNFLVVDSNVRHELTGSEYPQRKQDCIEASKILGVKSLRDTSMASLREKRDEMGDRIYQRALHVVSEIERCVKAASAMTACDYEELGRLMYQSHVSLRDLYAVSSPEQDELVDITMKEPGVYGARMTGGGFGGCIVVLVKESKTQDVITKINQSYSKTPTCFVFTAVDGASQLSL